MHFNFDMLCFSFPVMSLYFQNGTVPQAAQWGKQAHLVLLLKFLPLLLRLMLMEVTQKHEKLIIAEVHQVTNSGPNSVWNLRMRLTAEWIEEVRSFMSFCKYCEISPESLSIEKWSEVHKISFIIKLSGQLLLVMTAYLFFFLTDRFSLITSVSSLFPFEQIQIKKCWTF